ncbi:hypothetical protein EON80_06300, partial [bacterium]
MIYHSIFDSGTAGSQQPDLQTERLRLAARACGMGIWDYHIEADQLYCDSRWYEILGLDSTVPITSINDFKPY